MTDTSTTLNPLLQSFDEAPFSRIENHHFKPAFVAAIELSRKEIANITNQSDIPTFKNTIEALRLWRWCSIGSHFEYFLQSQ